jgi:preprotein translocase subunit SecG
MLRPKFSSFSFSARKWRNWQTHHLEEVAPRGLGVQVPSSAPSFEVQVRMIWFVGTIHIIVCIVLIGVVLLQQGKSADLAGAFGGQGSQTAFGPRGAANLLTKVTTWSAIIFMFTSIGLTVLIQRSSGGHSVLSGIKTTHTAPATPAKPTK